MAAFSKEKLLNLINPGNIRSVSIDFAIVLADFLTGYILADAFHLDKADQLMFLFSVPFISVVGLYLAGLIVGARGIEKYFFGLPGERSHSGILLFNSILIGIFASAGLMIQNKQGLAVLAFFGIGIIWYILHSRIVGKSRNDQYSSSKTFRIIAAAMMFPFMLALVMFTNFMSSFMTNTHDLYGNVSEILMFTGMTWSLSYIPRKFVKAMLNVKMAESFFVIFLLIDYSLKVILS